MEFKLIVVGPFIAMIGIVSFLYIGLSGRHLPPFRLGYLNFSTFFCIVSSSIIAAPLGRASCIVFL